MTPTPLLPVSLLVVDDEETIRETLGDFFESLGATVTCAATATAGRQAAMAHAPDVALVDLRLPDAGGVQLIEALRADDPDLQVIVLTGHADVPSAVQVMQQGAADLLEKPVDLERLEAAVRRAAEVGRMRRELAVLRARATEAETAAAAPSSDDAIERLVGLAARNDDAPVLVTGETGTGKGFVARRIHDHSARAARPFVEINCASLSATFTESELFGHEKGAFTDARVAKRGLLEVAGGGTVFLDELAEMPLEVQPKLLKVIEERTYRRLGGTATMQAAARLVVATHRDLAAEAAAGRFRADLFYRLQVLTISLPPLRARRDEIERFARLFLPRGASLDAAALQALVAYDWPGNLRELKNTLWRAAILAEGAAITPAHLGLPAGGAGGAGAAGAAGAATGSEAPADEVMTIEEAERRAIAAALRATAGNRVRSAQLLGIARSTLAEKLRKYELG